MLKLLLDAAYVQFNILSLLVVEVFIYTYFGCRCIITFLEINDLLLFMFSVLLVYFSFCPRVGGGGGGFLGPFPESRALVS